MGKGEWVVDLKSGLEKMVDIPTQSKQWERRSIYRVPHWVSKCSSDSYKPQLVSIGPYNHGKENLKQMEEHKLRALLVFLKRSRKPIESYFTALAEVVQNLKDSYDQLDTAWQEDAEAFLYLMILDGCFILEVIHRAIIPDWKDDYACNDPVFSNHGLLYVLPFLKIDMLLLENQLPLLVLKKLLAVSNQSLLLNEVEEKMNRLILKFFTPFHPVDATFKCLHMLDMYRKSLLLEPPPRRPTHGHKYRKYGTDIIPSATELHEGGISFKKSRTSSLKDVSFHGHTLRLPITIVDDATERIFCNLMAFERLHVGAGNEVTSYVFFMDCLINSAKDVDLLQSRGILANAIGNNKEVVKLFDSLAKEITLDPDSFLDEVYRSVSRRLRHRFRTTWNKCRYSLIHTYFTSPWASVSVFAAVLIFTLTIVQTIYTVLSYIHRNK